jgi:hypothetical protein
LIATNGGILLAISIFWLRQASFAPITARRSSGCYVDTTKKVIIGTIEDIVCENTGLNVKDILKNLRLKI